MASSDYINFRDINNLQESIMILVGVWAKTEKTPMPRKEIIQKMTENGVKNCTTITALNSLLRKGYIRRSNSGNGNATSYVQLKAV